MNDLLLRRIFILAVIVCFGWILYLLQPVLAPFVASFVLAYLLNPLVKRLMRIGLARWLSITLVYFGILFGVVMASWFLLPRVWDQLVYTKRILPGAVHWFNFTVQPWIAHKFHIQLMKVDLNQLSKMVLSYIQTNYNVDSLQQLMTQVAQSGMNIIHVGGLVVLIPIISFYFLLDWRNMLQRLQRLIPRRMEAKVVAIVHDCDDVLTAFVKGQMLVMLLLGVVYAVGLQLVGIQVGLIIGMVAGLASVIPYLGFATGLVAAVFACFLQYGVDWMHLILVGVVFMIGQIIEGYILQPFLLGDKIGLSPVAVVFAILAGAQLYGFVGMLVALPVAAIFVVLMRHLLSFYLNSEWYAAANINQSSQAAEHVQDLADSDQALTSTDDTTQKGQDS